MKDIDIKCNDGNFKLRTTALIIKENKILLEKSRREEGYCFPGGHVEFGTTTTETILREVKEEINMDAKIIDLYCIAENIYLDKNNKINQEINYYYKLECDSFLNFDDFTITENDKGEIKTHYFKWFDISEIDKIDLRPIGIVKNIQKNINLKDQIMLFDQRK